jgi:hypothetical protein
MEFPHAQLEGRFDFILISEVAYYWSDDDLRTAIDFVAGAAGGGTLELVHFLPKVDDYVRDGDAVHAAFIGDARFGAVASARGKIPHRRLARALSGGTIGALPAPRAGCRITVCIPARDEAALIGTTLAALCAQRTIEGEPLPRDFFDVIVFANNCTDGTAAAVRQVAARTP